MYFYNSNLLVLGFQKEICYFSAKFSYISDNTVYLITYYNLTNYLSRKLKINSNTINFLGASKFRMFFYFLPRSPRSKPNRIVKLLN